MTSVKLNSIYYSTIQSHIQVVTLVLRDRSETTPHICRMQSCTPRYEKFGSLSQSTFLVPIAMIVYRLVGYEDTLSAF